MATFLLSLALVLVALLGLSVGVIFGRAPVKGSCGGLACLPKADCAACPHRTGPEDDQ